MPVFNSAAPSSIQIDDAIQRLLADVESVENRGGVILELARSIVCDSSDQVFQVIAELDDQWAYHPAELLAGQDDSLHHADLYDLATRAIQNNELVVEEDKDIDRLLAAIPLALTTRRVEVIVANIRSSSLPLLVTGAHFVRNSTESHEPSPSTESMQTMAALIEAVSTIESADSLKAAAQKSAEFIAELINGQLESAGIVEVHIGISNVKASPVWTASADGRKPDAETMNRVEAVMAETKARQQSSRWPVPRENASSPAPANRFAALCLKSLANHSECSDFYSFELIEHSGQSVGVVVLASEQPLKEESLNHCDALAMPIGSALSVVRRAELNHVGKFFRSIATRWEQQKVRTIGQIAAALFAVALIPFPYSVPSKSELQPGTRRYVSAPFDAKLADCSIEPGDWVEKGQELARLDEQEVRLELAQVEADLYRAMKDQDGLVARHESGEAALAKLKADALAARQQLLRYRCDNLILRSPIDGMVVAGDFKDAQGMPLGMGDSIFEIAKMEALRLEVLIPAEDIHLVTEGAHVHVRFDALPFESFALEIERLNPASELRDGSNVFVATAMMPNPDFRLRPGMQGAAQVRVAWMPISWHYLRKPLGHSLRWLGW